MKAKEFLRTIWFHEPKKYHEKEFVETMEAYAKHQNKELVEENELLKEGYKQMSDFMRNNLTVKL